MNNLLPYEEQIAEKLAELPLPNLQDAIWARIENLLDADDALDSNETAEEQIVNETKAGKTVFNKMMIVLLVILALVVSIILIKKQRNAQPQRQQPANTDSVEKVEVNKIKEQSDIKKTDLPAIQKANAKTSDTNQQLRVTPDTSVTQITPIFKPPVPDSSVKKEQPAAIPVKKDSVTKKPKGVPGISDADYRMKAVAKDSIKN